MLVKLERVQLNARLAPADAEKITERARRESRSLGEVIALMIRENELLCRETTYALAERGE
jgi:hypothetical protein